MKSVFDELELGMKMNTSTIKIKMIARMQRFELSTNDTIKILGPEPLLIVRLSIQ